MGLLALVGCGFVLVNEEKTMRKAFFLGVSAPALILNTMSVADPPVPREPASQEAPAESSRTMLLPSWGVQTLHAASQVSEETSPGSEETRSLTVQANLPVSGGIYVRDTSSTEEREIEKDADGGWTVPTTPFYVVFRGTIPDQVPVETPSAFVKSGSEPIVLRLSIAAKQTFVGGVLDGLSLDNLAQQFRRSDASVRVS